VTEVRPAASSGPHGWVFYDGSCGVCSRWVPFWTPALARVGLETTPLQRDWVRERTGLSEEALLADLTVLLDDGRVIRGADAYRYAMRRIWWAVPFYLLSLTPGFRQLFDAGYRSFARHRYAVSDVCRLDAPESRPRQR
jgi:predicted DCC family thiol-disulfide oxidoreductase YuxK